MADLTDDLIEIAEAIGRGEVPEFQHNECFTAGAFDLLLVHARGAEAFELLETLGKRRSQVTNSPAALAGYFFLLSQVARRAETTELPPSIRAAITAHPEHSAELRQWYRLEA